jgi:hypothetical protein
MPDTAAERARRARRHKKGDHSLCDPARRCEIVEQVELAEAVAATDERTERVGSRYGPRGRTLWDAVVGEPGIGPVQRDQLDEACRMADRLDRLHHVAENKGTWLRYEAADGGDVVITIDSVLAELRQLETAHRAVLAELDKALTRAAKSTPNRTGALAPSKKGGGLSDLTAKIAARRTGTAG